MQAENSLRTKILSLGEYLAGRILLRVSILTVVVLAILVLSLPDMAQGVGCRQIVWHVGLIWGAGSVAFYLLRKWVYRGESKHGIRLGFYMILAVVCVLTGGRVYLAQTDLVHGRSALEGFVGRRVTVSGWVVRQPYHRHKNQQLVLRVDNVNDGEVRETLTNANVPRHTATQVGQYCILRGRIDVPEKFEGFDYPRYLAIRNIFYQVNSRSVRCEDREITQWSLRVYRRLFQIKGRVVSIVMRALPEPQASLLAGILFGDKRVFGEDFSDALRHTGTSHIVSASGYNVTLIILGVGTFAPFLPFRVRILLTVVMVWAFAILAGMGASIVRASLMGTIFLMGKYFKRAVEVNQVFSLSIGCFLFYKPLIIYDVGFQLSASATAGLLYLLPYMENRFRKYVGRFVRENILPSLAATIATLPVSVYTFGGFSLLAVPVNAVVMPIGESTIFIGLVAVSTSFVPVDFVQTHIAPYIFQLAYIQLKSFELVIEFANKVPWNYINVKGG